MWRGTERSPSWRRRVAFSWRRGSQSVKMHDSDSGRSSVADLLSIPAPVSSCVGASQFSLLPDSGRACPRNAVCGGAERETFDDAAAGSPPIGKVIGSAQQVSLRMPGARSIGARPMSVADEEYWLAATLPPSRRRDRRGRGCGHNVAARRASWRPLLRGRQAHCVEGQRPVRAAWKILCDPRLIVRFDGRMYERGAPVEPARGKIGGLGFSPQ
jgi:hypothetical protein